MIKNFLSRYQFRYPELIVYMLQASEYKIADFLSWYHRTHNFSEVKKRGELKKTNKARVLLWCAWFIIYLIYIDGIAVLFSDFVKLKYLVAVLEILIAPYLLPYLLIIPVFIGNSLQKLVELNMILNTKKILNDHKGKKIAIVGSYGKTTMREVLKSVLSVGKKVSAPGENFNTPIGISNFVNTLNGDEEVLIFELGEYYPGDIKKLCEMINPDIGIVTGINEAHLSKFKNIQKTIKTIFEISDFLKDKPLYVNSDNNFVKENTPKNSITYSTQEVGRLKIKDGFSDLQGTTFTLMLDENNVPVFSKILGLHNIGPMATAADIALSFGFDMQQIKSGINSTQPFDHRMEKKAGPNGSVIVDDSYNGNPDGVKAGLNFLRSLFENRKIYITPGLVEMGSKTEEIHIKIGEQIAEARIDKVILIETSATEFIKKGLEESSFVGEVLTFKSMPEALDALNSIALEDDVILIQNDWPDQYL